MCVLRDTYMFEEKIWLETEEAPKAPGRQARVYEFRHQDAPRLHTTHFWCRTCKEKTPVHRTKHCDCGMILCSSCWQEWEVTCPTCDTSIL